MFALSWPGVRYCMEALWHPKRQDEAVDAITRVGRIRESTATRYLRLAHRLGLVEKDAEGRYAIAAHVDRPEELIQVSTLVRLFHAWQQLEAEPLRHLDAQNNPFRSFGIGDLAVLHSADAFARRLQHKIEALPLNAALLLEVLRLWADTRRPSEEKPLYSAVDAFQVLKEILAVSGHSSGDLVEQFVRACMLLYGKKLVRLAIVQYAVEANRPYASFRTPLGYIKWIHDPAPFRSVQDAQPVQATRKLVSAG